MLLSLGLLVLSCPPADAATGFRKKKKHGKPTPPPPQEKHIYVSAVVALEHVRDGSQVDDVDQDAIIDRFIQAYNTIHKYSDIRFVSGFVYKTFINREEDDEDDKDKHDGGTRTTLGRYNPFHYWGRNTFYVWFDAKCRYCYDDLFDVDDDVYDDRFAKKHSRPRHHYYHDDYWFTADAATAAKTTRADVILIAASRGQGGSKAHQAFQDDYCNQLRQCGNKPLEQVTHCEVEFTYTTTDLEALLHQHNQSLARLETENQDALSIAGSASWFALKADETETVVKGSVRGHWNMDHVYGNDFFAADLDILAKIFQDGYNTVHSSSALSSVYKVTGVELLRRVDLPEGNAGNIDEAEEEDDDDGAHDYYNRMWWIKITYECDSAAAAASGSKSFPCHHHRLPPCAAAMHKAFEAKLCIELNKSGLVAYQRVRDCEVHYVLEEEEEEAEKENLMTDDDVAATI